jgi:hypothetical protein
MTQPSRIAKRLLLPVLLVAALVGVQVVLAAAPTTGFTFDPTAPICNQPVAFTSTAADDDGDALTVEWDFDYAGAFNADATGPTANHTFTTTGSHPVRQRVTAGADPAVESTTQTLTVGATTPPTVTAGGPTGPVQPNTPVPFTGSATGPGGAMTYAWDFDYDGVTFNVDASEQNPSHTYTTSGPHTARLRATDACGGQGFANVPVSVANANPTASFTMTAAGSPVTLVNPGTAVTFTATASDPNGDTPTYAWDVDGDAATSFTDGNGATTTKTYTPFPTAKTVTARLRVTDGNGGEVIVEHSLIVNKAPFASFTINPPLPLVNESVSFDALPPAPAISSFDFENGITTFEWDFDYAGTAASFTPDATGSLASHTFTSSGAKNVALRLTDADGGVTVLPRTVDVQVSRPRAGLTYSPADPVPGQAVTLTSTSAPSNSPSAPSLTATQWDFDYSPAADFTLDGAGASIVTSFATPGPHNVAVRVSETGGGTAIEYITINVNAPPQASFTVSPSKPIEGRPVTFASTSGDPDGPLAKQEWDFNNDGTWDRTGAVVSSSRLKKGTRPIKLRVTDSKGAVATTTVPVKVAAKPLLKPLDVDSTVSYLPKQWGMHVTAFTVDVQSKTSVAVTCKGRGCPRGTFRQHSKKKKGALLTFRGIKGNLRAGATINVIYTRPGHMTGWERITVLGNNQRPRRFEGCKIGKAKKPQRCSTKK